ncbi:uncharacterized protein G2W53_038223 [Senna tora]|uniref:Uncharacterized protein n=1 Tax=Senna tora TaxID=362788 RepID=A0A834W1Q6_9FABA|nr:uncharacterized protein G2W53_038223 [Senna tora]
MESAEQKVHKHSPPTTTKASLCNEKPAIP